MEIHEIKSRLTITEVLQHYGLKPDRNKRLNCPFHEDKTPSMQVYPETDTVYCFSSNCKTHGGSMDVIDFVMFKEACNKHKAIMKCKQLLGYSKESPQSGKQRGPQSKDQTSESERSRFLAEMFSYFSNGVHNSGPARKYLKKRCLDKDKLEVGYNSGQFHHAGRFTQSGSSDSASPEQRRKAVIKQSVKYGLLLDKGLKSRTGGKAYSPFGKWCIVFALKNKEGELTGLYFRSTLQDASTST